MKGATGPTGLTGATGSRGPAGHSGATGRRGYPGSTGRIGSSYLYISLLTQYKLLLFSLFNVRVKLYISISD